VLGVTFTLNQRRACKVVGQPRATQRHAPQPDAEETRLRERLNEFIASPRLLFQLL
jgi:hypothetical protein